MWSTCNDQENRKRPLKRDGGRGSKGGGVVEYMWYESGWGDNRDRRLTEIRGGRQRERVRQGNQIKDVEEDLWKPVLSAY